MTFPDVPRAIYGVDFSGAQDAGRKIWVAAGHVDGDRLRIDSCLQAAELPGGGPKREQAHAALCHLIAESNARVFGLDFPFSVSYRAIPYPTWEAFALNFAQNYPTPAAFRDGMKRIGQDAALLSAAAIGHESILRRQTDKDAATPFAPNNERLYRQTYYGIHNLLLPLIRYGRARILPMQEPVAGLPWLIEICPASTLKQPPFKHLYLKYKGRGEAEKAQRIRILIALETRGVTFMQPATRSKVLADNHGDALDSVIAAYATWRVLQDPESLIPRQDHEYDRTEGRVYFQTD